MCGDYISLATFEFCKKLRIVDFSSDKKFSKQKKEYADMNMGLFFTLFMSGYFTQNKNGNEYRFSQIVSDYLRKLGIDGVAYVSLRTGKATGTNYTIFNCHKNNVKYIDSRILYYHEARHSFWDMNNEGAIFSCLEEDLIYNNQIANKVISNLQNKFK